MNAQVLLKSVGVALIAHSTHARTVNLKKNPKTVVFFYPTDCLPIYQYLV